MPFSLLERQTVRRRWTECQTAADHRRNARRIARYRARMAFNVYRRDWRLAIALVGRVAAVAVCALFLGAVCAITLIGAFVP